MAERTEAPTPRKRDEARAKGQGVGRSWELSMGMTLAVGTMALASLLPGAPELAAGLLRNFPDKSSLIRQLSPSQLPMALEAAQGRMKKKVLGAEEALQGGVSRVIIADGRIENPISMALDGNGTIIS